MKGIEHEAINVHKGVYVKKGVYQFHFLELFKKLDDSYSNLAIQGKLLFYRYE
jgi:hypothetical protein